MEEALPKWTSKASDMLTMKRSALVQVNNMRKEMGSSSSTRHLFIVSSKVRILGSQKWDLFAVFVFVSGRQNKNHSAQT